MTQRSRIAAGIVLLLGVLLGLTSTAWAYWTTSGAGAASASTGTLNPPGTPIATVVPGAQAVALTWTAPAGLAPQGYYIVRTRDSDGASAFVCASSPTALIPVACTDSPVPAGTFHYTVTAVQGSWTAPSAVSNSVAIVADVTAPVVSVTSVNGLARTFPYSTNGALISLAGACGTSPGDAATVSPLIDGAATVPATAPCLAGTWTLTLSTPLSSQGTRTLSATQTDVAGNTGNAPARTLIIDTTGPTVTAISRAGAAAVNTGPVSWTVAFSEPVGGVAVTDFALVRSGLGGTLPALTTASAGGGGPLSSTWTVTASLTGATGANNGSLRLDLAGAGVMVDAAGNPLSSTSFTGQAYTYDTTKPSLFSLQRADSTTVVNTGPVSWTATFSEPVSGVVPANFTLAGSGLGGTAPSISAVSAGGIGAPSATWTITASLVNATGSDVGSLGLNLITAGAIADAATNPLSTATATGPTYTYDTTRPSVTGVSSSLADGSYRAGQVVPVLVTFTESVQVNGAPQLRLTTGPSATTVVDYTSGSGSKVLRFDYTVGAGDTSADLDYASTTALALNGGTIRDVATNTAVLTLPAPAATGSLGASKALVIDTTAPVVTVTKVNNVVQAFPYATKGNVTSIAGTCGVLSGDVTPVSVEITGATTTTATPACSGTGTGTWTLNVGSWATNGTRNVSVTQLDAAGNTGTVQQDVTVDKVRPTLTSITRAGAETVNAGPLSWTATFSEPVVGVATTNFRLATSALGGTAPSIADVSPVGGSPSATWTVTASLAGATGANNGSIQANLNGRGAITDPATNTLTTTSMNGESYTYDTTRPTVTGVSSQLADGSYRAGQVVPVTVTFSEPVVVTGTPQLSLATGTPATTPVAYTSAAAADVLTFEYTVEAGHTSADLDYAVTTALSLNGATIADAAGNDALLTLPAPGATGSLAAGKALVIDTTPPVVTVTKIEVAFPFLIYPVTVSGTSEAGAGPVTVFLCYNAGPTCDAGNATQTFSVTGATWTTGWSSQWGRGTWYASAEQTDAAGNVGTSPVFGPLTS